MNLRKLEDALPLIGTALGGIVIGVFAANGFTALGWELEWETLAAGVLGLAGGWLAYKAATDHRRATENRNEYIFRANHFAELIKANQRIEQLLANDFEHKIISDPTFGVDGVIKLIDEAAKYPAPLPMALSKNLETLCDTLALLKQFKSKMSGHYEMGMYVGIAIEHPEILKLLLETVQSCLSDIQTSALAKEISRIH